MKLHFVKKEIIKDEPIKKSKDDCFSLDESVDNFWNYVNSYEPPLVVGVFDNWGSGKSSFLNLVKDKYNKENFLTFHAWKYKEKESLWRALILELNENFTSKKFTSKIKEFFYTNISSKKYPLKIIIPFISISLIQLGLFFVGLGTDTYFTKLQTSLSISNFLLAFLSLISITINSKENLGFEQINSVYEYTLDEINKSNDTKYVIVEDLDRCSPKDSIDLLDDLKGFFKTDKNKKLVFIVPLDLNVLENEIKNRFSTQNINSDDYFDKIIDVPFYLPHKENITYFLDNILDKEGKSRLEKDFNTLIQKAPNKNTTFLEFLEQLFKIAEKDSPRNIKQILLNLDFSFNVLKEKNSVNTISLLIIILTKEKFDLGYNLLYRIANFEHFKVNNYYINPSNFLAEQQKQRFKSYFDLANQLKIPNNNKQQLGGDPLQEVSYYNYIKIRDFGLFLTRINEMFGLSNDQKELFIPKDVISLKKHLYSIKYIFNKSEGKTYFWGDLKRIKEENMGAEETRYYLKCPNCIDGVIIREKDNTEGYKFSSVSPCNKCGFDKVSG